MTNPLPFLLFLHEVGTEMSLDNLIDCHEISLRMKSYHSGISYSVSPSGQHFLLLKTSVYDKKLAKVKMLPFMRLVRISSCYHANTQN